VGNLQIADNIFNFCPKKKKDNRKLLSQEKFVFALPFFLSPKPEHYELGFCSRTLILEDFPSKRENAL